MAQGMPILWLKIKEPSQLLHWIKKNYLNQEHNWPELIVFQENLTNIFLEM